MLLTKRGKANQRILHDWLRENNAFNEYFECIKKYDEKPDEFHNANEYINYLNNGCIVSAFLYRCNWNNFNNINWDKIGRTLMHDILNDKIVAR